MDHAKLLCLPVSSKIIAIVCIIGLLIIQIPAFTGCGSSGGNDSDSEELPPPVTVEIKADEGGTITLENGASLTIPVGALSEDTSITVSPVEIESLGDAFVVGLQFEPDGLKLSKNATCVYPLPSEWDGDEAPFIYASDGDDPANFYNTWEYAEISGQKGSYMAQVQISHFSSKSLVKNCHTGTWYYMLESFQERGCSKAQAIEAIKNYTDENDEQPFKNFDLPDEDDNYDIQSIKGTEKLIQAFLSTYFEKIYSYDEGEDFTNIDALLNYTRDEEDGRRVAFSFTSGEWQERSDGLYKTFKHTATLELVDGQVKLRNSVAATDEIENALIAKNGENVFWYPKEGELTAELLKKFRESLTIEALEDELCGATGCLSDKTKNSYGIKFGASLEDREDMPLPWTAMNIYVEKSRISESPCQGTEDEDDDSGNGGNDDGSDETDDTLNVTIDINGYDTSWFEATGDKCYAGLGQITDGADLVELDGIPTVMAYTGDDFYNYTNYISISLHPELGGTGTYTSIGDAFDLSEGFLIGVNYSNSAIYNNDYLKTPVYFYATSGEIVITHFGTQIGDRVSGTFDVSIRGKQSLCTGNDCGDPQIITGTLSGRFDTILVEDQ